MNNHRLFLLLVKEKKLFLSCVAVFVLGLIAYLCLGYVPKYQSTTKLFIKNVFSGAVVASYGDEKSLASESGFSNPLFNYLELIRSEMLAEHSYAILKARYPHDLERLSARTPQQWQAIYPSLVEAKVIPSTDIIQIKLKWSSKQHIADVSRILLENLREANLEIMRGVTVQQREYLDQQLDNVSQELLDVRTQILAFKINNRTVDISDETGEIIRTRIEMQKQLNLLAGDISFNNRKSRALVGLLGVHNAKDAMLANSIGSDTYLANLNDQLVTLEKEYNGLSTRFTDSYPAVAEVKKRIEVVKSRIAERRQEVLGKHPLSKALYNKTSSDIVTDLARVEADAAAQRAQYAVLQQGLDKLDSQERDLPAKQLGLDELMKKELALANAYDNVKKKQLETHIRENSIVNNIVTLSSPSPGKLDVKDLALTVFSFLALGLAVGVGLAWVKEGVKDEWLDTSEVELTTGKPVLGVMPWLPLPPGNGATLSANLGNPELMRSFDSMAQGIINRARLENVGIIAFCSPSERRQSSQVAAHLALSLAGAGYRTILLDADLINPMRHLGYLDTRRVPASQGLSEIIPKINRQIRFGKWKVADLEMREPILQTAITRIEASNSSGEGCWLDYLSSARITQGRIYDFVASQGFKALLQYLRRRYEFVLLDTPALPIHFPETDVLASLADGVVIVSPLTTRREELIRHVRRFEAKGHKVLGILMRTHQPEM